MSREIKTIDYFDEFAFGEWENRMIQHAQEFNKAITALQAEGIDTSLKAISEYPTKFKGLDEGEPSKYQNHFRELYKEAEKRAGWLPKNEKDRMFNSFVSVCNKTINHAEKICTALNFGLKLTEDKEGTARPDTDLTAEISKRNFTYKVDASEMQEHWRMLSEIRDKMDALKKWEMEHKMPPVDNDKDYHLFGAFINRKVYNGQETTMSEQEHNNQVWQYFKLPGNKE